MNLVHYQAPTIYILLITVVPTFGGCSPETGPEVIDFAVPESHDVNTLNFRL